MAYVVKINDSPVKPKSSLLRLFGGKRTINLARRMEAINLVMALRKEGIDASYRKLSKHTQLPTMGEPIDYSKLPASAPLGGTIPDGFMPADKRYKHNTHGRFRRT